MEPTIANVELGGELVLIRPQSAEMASEAFRLIHGEEEILRWLVWDGPERVDDLREFYRRWVVCGDDGCDYHFGIFERAAGRLVGSIGMRFSGHPGVGDVGYWIGTPYWGRGFGSEALRLATHLAFHYLEAQSLFAWVFVGNAGSRAVLEHNGFSLVRTEPERVRKRDRVQDEWYFVLLRSEWAARETWRPAVERVERAC